MMEWIKRLFKSKAVLGMEDRVRNLEARLEAVDANMAVFDGHLHNVIRQVSGGSGRGTGNPSM